MDTGIDATTARLRRLYSGESCRDIYGVKTFDAAVWHREVDERALAKAWLAFYPLLASAPALLAALAEFVRLSDDGNATAEQWGRAKAEAVQVINTATGSQT